LAAGPAIRTPRALAEAEAVAHSAGFRSELHVSRPQAVTTVAISWSDAARRREAAERAEAAHESIEYFQGRARSWDTAARQVEIAREGCSTHLGPVVQDPAWVVDRVVAAPQEDQKRMLNALRSTPTRAASEIGERAALVADRRWWPFRRTPSTLQAQRRAPMAAAWLGHFADSTRAEASARRALAADLGFRGDCPPDQLRARLAAELADLTTRGADYETLVRSLADAVPEQAVLKGIDRWPPHLKEAVERVTGASISAARAEVETPSQQAAVGLSIA
jgi:hypothetical protein